jgi:selenocysteine lyase/cysteine desulfurase
LGVTFAPGDEIVLTRLDHDANVAPWKALEAQGAVIRMVDIDTEECTLDMADMARAIGPRTKLVAVGYASNAVGTINDVATITRMAHAVGALVYIDAVHYAPHGPIDVQALDCDFLACSPYKFFAPHMGALYGKREHLARLRPYKVRPASDDIPDRWETGTKNHEGLAGGDGGNRVPGRTGAAHQARQQPDVWRWCRRWKRSRRMNVDYRGSD